MPDLWVAILGHTAYPGATAKTAYQRAKGELEMAETVIQWDEIDLAPIACPKCGEIGKLQRAGRDARGKYRRFFCRGCKAVTSETLLEMPEVKVATKQVSAGSNNTSTAAMRAELDEIKAMLTKLLTDKGAPVTEPVTVTQAVTKPEPFNWDDYSLELQERIKGQLLPLIRENPDWGVRKLEKAMKGKHGKAMRRGVIIKVLDAYATKRWEGYKRGSSHQA